MKTKDINTLSQLRQAKMDLKLKMKQTDRSMDDNIIYAGLKKIFAGKKRNRANQNLTILKDGNKNSIDSSDTQISRKSGVWKYLNPALSIAISIAVPLIATKTVDLINRKL